MTRRAGNWNNDTEQGRQIRVAEISIQAAQGRLEGSLPELCRRFIEFRQADLVKWQQYLASLEHCDSITDAFLHLRLDYAKSLPPRIR